MSNKINTIILASSLAVAEPQRRPEVNRILYKGALTPWGRK